VATLFVPLFLVSYHQKLMIVHNDMFFLFSTSLFSCVPYIHSQTSMLTMKALTPQARSLFHFKLQARSLFHLSSSKLTPFVSSSLSFHNEAHLLDSSSL